MHLAVTGNVFDGVFLCCPFFKKVSWMRSRTLLSQFPRVFLPTLLKFWILKIIAVIEPNSFVNNAVMRQKVQMNGTQTLIS